MITAPMDVPDDSKCKMTANSCPPLNPIEKVKKSEINFDGVF
jgi:hypothetical protein